jgi:uncharacterized membrane protein
MLTTLLTNPVFALKVAAKEEKLVYVATMLLPVAFLPLFAKPGRFMLAYGAIFTMLATRNAVFSTHFQYVMLLLPVVVALVPVGLQTVEAGALAVRLGLSARQVRAGALGFMLVASGLVSWKFGAIVENSSFRGGFTKITRSLTEKHHREYQGLLEVISQLPPNASVTVTDSVGPHVSNRMAAYLYRYKKPSDYVLVDERELRKGLKSYHQQRVKRGELRQIAQNGRFKLFKVDPSKAHRRRRKAPEARPAPSEPVPTPRSERAGKPSPQPAERTRPSRGRRAP